MSFSWNSLFGNAASFTDSSLSVRKCVKQSKSDTTKRMKFKKQHTQLVDLYPAIIGTFDVIYT